MNVFLYLVIASYGNSPVINRFQMPDKATCLESLAALKLDVSHGAESEYAVSAFCAGDDMQERLFRNDGHVWESPKHVKH